MKISIRSQPIFGDQWDISALYISHKMPKSIWGVASNHEFHFLLGIIYAWVEIDRATRVFRGDDANPVSPVRSNGFITTNPASPRGGMTGTEPLSCGVPRDCHLCSDLVPSGVMKRGWEIHD